jgi:hypothetical protein
MLLHFFRLVTYTNHKPIIMLTIRLASILRKLLTSTSGTSCILHNSREPTTIDLVFKCCILHKIIVRYIKKSESCRISRLFALRNECSFYSVKEGENQDNSEISGRLVTLATGLINHDNLLKLHDSFLKCY